MDEFDQLIIDVRNGKRMYAAVDTLIKFGALDVSSAERLSFCKQRDELAEALRKIARVDAPTFPQAFGRCQDIAKVALAKLS